MKVMLQTKAVLDRKNSETKALMLVSKKEQRILETLDQGCRTHLVQRRNQSSSSLQS